MSEHQVEPHVFIIIGATGDLTRRKLLPALYHLRDQGVLENLSYQSVTGLGGFTLTMNDGHQTLNSETSLGTVAELSTDTNGQIDTWSVFINSGGTNNGGISTQNSQYHSDQGRLACCDPDVAGNLAYNMATLGTWGSTSAAADVTNLITIVNNPALILTSAQKKNLTSKLNKALTSIQAGLNQDAIKQLNSFISSVKTLQKTNKLSTATATNLITAAQAIIAKL